MNNKLILLLFLFLPILSFTQIVKGIVQDENGIELIGVTILNSIRNTGTTSGFSGDFSIKAKKGDVLKLSYVGKQTQFYTIQSKDSSYLFITLKENLSNLPEFIVDGRKIKEVSAEINDNILDYYSLGKNTFLVLKRSLRDYKLTIEGVDTVYKTFPLENLNPKSLFLDVLGNFHILCKDSVRQIHFNSKMEVVECISHKKFQQYIHNIVYTNDSMVIQYEFTNHNKLYSLYKIKKDSIEVMSRIFDELGFKVARQHYNEIINIYYGCVDEHFNLIINETWYGDLISLFCMDGKTDLLSIISWFKHIRAREIKVQTFEVNNKLLTFNFIEDSLSVFNLKGKLQFKTHLNIPNKGFNETIIYDKEQQTFYGYCLNGGLVSLAKLSLENGNVTVNYTIESVSFPQNLKIIEGYAYFINPNKNGYKKLYRYKLE